MKALKFITRLLLFLFISSVIPFAIILYYLLNNITFKDAIYDYKIEYIGLYNSLLKGIK